MGYIVALTALAMVAYGISTATYVTVIPSVSTRRLLLVGAVLLITGYLLVTVAKAGELVQGKDDDGDPAVGSTLVAKVENAGYGALALFFTSSLFVGTSVTVQLYDPLAAAGYTAMFASPWLPHAHRLGAVFLVAYYVFGAIRKIGEPDAKNRLQLVSRALLAFYYTAVCLGATHPHEHAA